MDRFARLVARLLGVPVALVSLLEEDRQVFPGMVGLAEPWASSRETPLSHSLCRHVVDSGRPLVLPDARVDVELCTSPAIPDLGVIAYAGMPLTDAAGHVLGSLCAIDDRPREWGGADLTGLEDLAAACSAALRLRILTQQTLQERASAESTGAMARAAHRRAESARRAAESAHRAAEEGRREAQQLERRARHGMEQAELLLRASEDLAQSIGVGDVRRRLHGLFGEQGPYVGLLVAEEHGLRRVYDPDADQAIVDEPGHLAADDDFPTARAFRERRAVLVPDRETFARDYSAGALAGLDALGATTALCLPLQGSTGTVGVLTLCWRDRHDVTLIERATFTAVAGYVSQAVERALFVEERVSVARQLQAAMLTELPVVEGLEIAAVYVAAAAGDMVGGDWYDAYPLPPATPGGAAGLAVTAGDITGHDTHAATVMGQVRSMLRQATFDHPPYGPAAAVSALDQATTVLGLEPGGTLVHTRLEPAAAGAWALTWCNAGHPAPLLMPPGGLAQRLVEHGPMVHPVIGTPARSEQARHLEPGALLFLYTDGVVERRGQDIDEAIDTLAALVTGHGHRPLPELLDTVVKHVAAPVEDDITLIAVRVSPDGP
ncbi:GAF domain-containing SpoIIE family protein phosphatase [Streptomyces montanisoli]|nr:SpoIIE family protein phosphatase [Streptomyces montanisoli]